MRKENMEKRGIALSSVGNYEIYRQLWNIDLPQDVSNFRQIQEEINKAESDIEKQRQYFYSKAMIKAEEIESKIKNGITVRDFIPTAGIIRVDLGNGRKIDLIANYPFDKLEEGANLQLLGEGFERREAEFEGELFYTKDLRGKKLAEIKLSQGLTLEEAQKLLEVLENDEDLEELRERLSGKGIDLSEIDKNDIEEVKEVFEALKEEYDNLNSAEKKILQYAGNIKGKEDLTVAITLKDVIDRLTQRKRVGGKVFNYRVEFYPLNGIIIGEDNNKELYFVFSPERVDWKEQGIGLAKRLDEYEYKLGNSILTIIQHPSNYNLIKNLELLKDDKNEKISEELKNAIEKRKERLIKQLERKLNEMYNAEGNLEVSEDLFRITSNLIDAIKNNNIETIVSLRNKLRDWRNQKIWEKVGKQRIDVNDLLKEDKKYNSDKKVYFLKWSIDEQRSPLAFYRKLFIATNTDGIRRFDGEAIKIYNNQIKLFLAKVPKIIPTDPTAGRTGKGTDLQFVETFKPYGFTVKNTTLKIGGEYLFSEQILKLSNKQARNKVEEILNEAIEKGWYPSQFISKVFKTANAKIYRNDVKEEKNAGFGLYVETYIAPIARTTAKLLQEGKKMAEAIREGNIETFENSKNRYFRLITNGLKDGEKKYYSGLEWLRDRISKFNQPVVYNTLLRELIDHYKVVAIEKSGIGEIIKGDKNLSELSKEEREKIAQNFEEMLNFSLARQLLKQIKEYNEAKENVERSMATNYKYEVAELDILNLLKEGKELSEKQRRFWAKTTRQMYNNIFIKTLSDTGLEWLKRKIGKKIEIMQDEKAKQFWENFLQNLAYESKNRLYTSQVAENVGIGESIGLKQLNRLIAIKNAIEVKTPEIQENLNVSISNIKVKVKDIEGEIPQTDKELKIAYGQTPLLVRDRKDLENIAKEMARDLNLIGLKGSIELEPTYETPQGIVYGFKLKLNGISKSIEYKPQRNIIPTVESAIISVLKKKGLMTELKEEEKERARQLIKEIEERRKETIKEQDIPQKTSKQKVEISEEEKLNKQKHKGKGLGLG